MEYSKFQHGEACKCQNLQCSNVLRTAVRHHFITYSYSSKYFPNIMARLFIKPHTSKLIFCLFLLYSNNGKGTEMDISNNDTFSFKINVINSFSLQM